MTHSLFIQILWKFFFLIFPCTLLAQELIVPEGLPLWYKGRLAGDYEISYYICTVMNGGGHDRLSGMNCFGAANGPKHPGKLFARATWRNGGFCKIISVSRASESNT